MQNSNICSLPDTLAVPVLEGQVAEPIMEIKEDSQLVLASELCQGTAPKSTASSSNLQTGAFENGFGSISAVKPDTANPKLDSYMRYYLSEATSNLHEQHVSSVTPQEGLRDEKDRICIVCGVKITELKKKNGNKSTKTNNI